MEEYARELLTGDRAAIGARYDRTGAILVRDGQKSFVSHGDIVARYAGAGWSPPAAFEWQDLSYEPAGPDAVVVVGRFMWTAAGGAEPLLVSYNALLRRQDGELRIRVEDEARIRTQRPPALESRGTLAPAERSSHIRRSMTAPPETSTNLIRVAIAGCRFAQPSRVA